MTVELSDQEKQELSTFLRYRFSLKGLRKLAFDLGVESSVFSQRVKRELVASLVEYCEREALLGCLAELVARGSVGGDLAPLPDLLPPCPPLHKLECSLSLDWSAVDISSLMGELAKLCHVGSDKVALIGATGPQVRLLAGLRGDKPSSVTACNLGRHRDVAIRSYDELDRRARRVWRLAVWRWPPEREGARLRPQVSWQEASRALGRGWRWGLAVSAVALIVGGYLFYALAWPEVPGLWGDAQAAWSGVQVQWTAFVREMRLWIEFLGSVSFSLIVLSWGTGLTFGALAALVHLLPHMVGWAQSVFPGRGWLSGVWNSVCTALQGHDRVVGTALNLVSGACALLILSRLVRRPLDYWDYGIQFAIALAIELIVLGILFGERRMGLLSGQGT